MTISALTAEPYQSRTGSIVGHCHFLNLHLLLGDIILLNANRVDP